ncbi:poly(A) RNA polymerase GLD2 isoform X2 [Myripristis murdjan]|uniref:polynucleotide adenylyltransferase n=1 Tax=Myripristis murdjan TaxID=586833 RepID=A0A667Y7D8_9TELE|nr:poly(A) RNA polymerase GLD2 isoform X2 [Myripristis murdjan]
MYPRSAPPRGSPAHNSRGSGNGLYHVPPVPRHHPQRLADAQLSPHNSFQVHPKLAVPDRMPPYEWKPPPPPPSPPVPGPHTMAKGRKRQIDDHSPHALKRQRLDSPAHHYRGSPLIHIPPPMYQHDQEVAGTSRMAHSSVDLSHHSPPYTQAPAIPGSSNTLQAYAKDKLSSQMVELFEACQQQTPDLVRKEMCRTRLQEDIQNIFPVARLYLTGSSMNGLGCRTSDADLCLVVVGIMNQQPDPIYILSVLQKFFNSLPYLERSQLIRAKVPILRFREKGSGLEFDLNINNTVGIRNTFLLRSYAYADLRVRPIILVVKKWARHHDINDASKGTLSSYTLVLMVLHYLQTLKEPVIPSLQKDYPECFSPLMEIDMVPEGPRHIPPYNSRNQSSLGDLLLGFLKYYATVFRWDKQVISVREARALPKTTSREWRDKFICVEEPFERNNVARAVHEKIKFDAIKAQFVTSSGILQQRKDLNSILPVRATINKESSRR